MTEPQEDDALVRALRELPRRDAEMDATVEGRSRAAARSAFARAHGHANEPWHGRFGATFGRAAVPVALAAVVVLYLSWAFSAASALVH